MGTSQPSFFERPDEGVAALLVKGADRRGQRGVLVEGRLRGELDGREDARIGVGLDLPQGGDHGRPADREADAPAGHVEGLGETVELDRDVLGAGDLQNAGDGMLEIHLIVGGILGHHEAVRAGQVDDPLVVGQVGRAPGRVVGIIEEHEPGQRIDIAGDCLQVGAEAKRSLQRHRVDVGSGEHAARPINGVAWVGHQADLTRVQGCEGEMGDPFLRPDQGEDLGIRVEVDAITHFAEGRDRPPQLRSALVEGVLVKRRVLDVVLKAPDNRSGSGPVGIAHSQIDDVATRGKGGFLLLVNLGEEIGGKLPEPFRLHERSGRHRTVSPQRGHSSVKRNM